LDGTPPIREYPHNTSTSQPDTGEEANGNQPVEGVLHREPRLVESKEAPSAEPPKSAAPNLRALLTGMVEMGASDLHLSAGNPPLYRLHGELVKAEGEPLTPKQIQEALYGMLTQRQREAFEDEWELDLSYSVPGVARFRVNVYRQRDSLGGAFRLIPFEIKTLEELGIPKGIEQFAGLPRGLVLVTGPTGSGKSTTLAALIDIVNRERASHIMSVEDPIEFLHRHKRSAVHQREVGGDTQSFAKALKHVLRQDPDVILVGEMRDLETIQMALTAAETGHLVFATLHTNSAPSSVDRIIDVFPPHQQQQIRVQLASSLQGVVTQTLVPTVDGKGRAAACEILVVTPAVSNLIREGKTHQIFSAMQAGGAAGMQTIDKALADLIKGGKVRREDAEEKAHDRETLAQLLKGGF
jgi:twitching motility protein PilT